MKRATEGDGDNSSDDFISIHALVKRATLLYTVLQFLLMYFNPRPREEGDMEIQGMKTAVKKFQSTPS